MNTSRNDTPTRGHPVVLFALLIFLLMVVASDASARTGEFAPPTCTPEIEYSCLPTCSSTDARFLAMVNGDELVSLNDEVMKMQIASHHDDAYLTIGIFDGDGTEPGMNLSRWDLGERATYIYTLYADPTGEGSSIEVDAVWREFSYNMPNNDWYEFTIANFPTARSFASGNYFYTLEIVRIDDVPNMNAFKVRTSGQVMLYPGGFCFQSNAAGMDDAHVIYPEFPLMHPTTYDGTFTFFFEVPTDQPDFVLWDGDFDHYKYDGSVRDTDDQDTPPSPPVWASPDTVEEAAQPANASSPFDDCERPPTCNDHTGENFLFYVLREPTVSYEVTFPKGCPASFVNHNPSGNKEWEQFRISTEPWDRDYMDYQTAEVPAGIYTLKVFGLDIQNHNAMWSTYRVLGVDECGRPVTPALTP